MKKCYFQLSGKLLLSTLLLLPSILFAQLEIYDYEAKLSTVATEIASKLSTTTGTIGVTYFTNMDNKPINLGERLSEEFALELMEKATSFSVIEPNRIHFFLEKERITIEQLANPSKAKRLARKAKTDLVILGKVSETETSIRLIIKASNLKTGQVIAFAKTNIQRKPPKKKITVNKPVIKKSRQLQPGFVEKGGASLLKKEVKKEQPQPIVRRKRKKKKTPQIQAYADMAEPLTLPAETTVNGLDFVLEKCQRVGKTTVVCLFTLTNRSGDVELKIDDTKARILDGKGQYYAAKMYQINKTQSGPYLSKILTTGTPTKVQIIFRNIPTDLKNIVKFEWAYYAGRDEKFELYQVPINTKVRVRKHK